jgi:hypothetical protein
MDERPSLSETDETAAAEFEINKRFYGESIAPNNKSAIKDERPSLAETDETAAAEFEINERFYGEPQRSDLAPLYINTAIKVVKSRRF